LPKDSQQGLGIDWIRDDPSVKLGPLALSVELAEIEQELKGVVPDFKIVGISPLDFTGFLWRFVVSIHQDLDDH
jgi:hypothetical protein